MQSERPRETFAALFARGWRIYAASFSASIAPSLLCFALPAALVSAVAYFAVVLLFQPALLAVRELVQALLSAGLNTQAMEEALARAGEYLSAITPEGVLSMLLGMLGLLLVLIPLELLASVVLMPIGQGAVAEAQSRMWHGVRIPARRALSAAGRRAGRLIVLSLCGMAAAYAVSLVVNLALSLLAALPGGAGIVLIGVYAVQLALTLGIGALPCSWASTRTSGTSSPCTRRRSASCGTAGLRCCTCAILALRSWWGLPPLRRTCTLR